MSALKPFGATLPETAPLLQEVKGSLAFIKQ